MNNLHDVVAANELLISMGGDDQLPLIAARAIERSLELQHRIDRALDYSKSAPSNSLHAKQMARILDGSITLDDELDEIGEHTIASPPKLKAVAKTRKSQAHRTQSGLKGRKPAERQAFRRWVKEQGLDVQPSGPVPQHFVDMYDAAQEELRRMRVEQRRTSV